MLTFGIKSKILDLIVTICGWSNMATTMAIRWLLVLIYVGFIVACPPECSCDRRHRVTCIGVEFTGEDLNKFQIPIGTKSVRLSGNGINNISANFIGLFENITSLEISKNNISVIPANTFIKLRYLKKLALRFNNVKEISTESFNGLQKLETLNLEGNLIQTLAKGIFSRLDSIKSLLLTGNKLRTIPNDIFTKMSNLRNLFLSDNNISGIGDKAFQNLSMTKLGISYNKIKQLPPYTFKGFEIKFKILLLNNPFDCNCSSLMTYLHHYSNLRYKIVGYCISPQTLKNMNILTAYRKTQCSLCDLNLCQNNANCTGTYSTMQCHCQKQYTGRYCEKNICQELTANIRVEKHNDSYGFYKRGNDTKEVIVYVKDEIDARTIAILYLTSSIEFFIILSLVVLLVCRRYDAWKIDHQPDAYTKRYNYHLNEEKVQNIYVTRDDVIKRTSSYF